MAYQYKPPADVQTDRYNQMAHILLKHQQEDAVLNYIPPEILNPVEKTYSIDVDAQELFLVVLKYRYNLKYPNIPLPKTYDLFKMQKDLLEPQHECVRGQDVCRTAAHTRDSEYFAVSIDRFMIATGIVTVCMTTGQVHYCDNTCKGVSDAIEFVCPFTGLCKHTVFKVHSEYDYWLDGSQEKDTSHKRKASGPSIISSGLKTGKRATYMARDANDDSIMHSLIDNIVPVNHVAYTIKETEEEKQRRLENERVEAAVQKIVNIQRNMTMPISQQTRKIDEGNTSEAKQALIFAQQRLEAFVQTMNTKQPKPIEITYAQFLANDSDQNILYAAVCDVFKMIFTYYQKQKLDEKAITTSASKESANYASKAIKYRRIPEATFAYAIFLSTFVQLSEPPSSEYIQRQERLIAELVLYYWTYLQPYFFNPPRAAQIAWLKQFREFSSGLVYLMRCGIRIFIEEEDEVALEMIPEIRFVVDYIIKPNNATSRNSALKWMFDVSTTISRIVQSNADDMSFVEKVCYTKALEVAKQNSGKLRQIFTV